VLFRSRGDKACVANYGHGTVSVLDRAQGWQIVKRLPTAKATPRFLSAPLESDFTGRLLVTAEDSVSVLDVENPAVAGAEVPSSTG
jgi:DNA-binding beta-propeller fold protein YncE